MAVTYGFFNSVNGDRKYNAEQMSEYFRGIVNEGVFQHLDGGLAVTAGTGLAVSVASGRAIIQNRWVQNSDAMTLSISAASETYARKDAVVVRLNYSTRSIEIAVKAGTPAASPVAPSMTRNSTTYEMALAYVNVAANATSVTITDKRSDSTVCGWATVAQSTSGEVDAQLNAMKTGFDGVEYPSPAEMVQGCDTKLQNEVKTHVGKILFQGTHTYSGVGNWAVTLTLSQAIKVAVRFPQNNDGKEFEISVLVNNIWTIVNKINDDNYHVIDIPQSVNNYIMVTYRGSASFTASCLIVDCNTPNLTNDVSNLIDDVGYLTNEVNPIILDADININQYGNNGKTTSFSSAYMNYTVCPCKKAEKTGKVTSLYIKSYISGSTKVYVGEVDQLYLFVPRKSFDITVSSGEQNIDVSDMNIYIKKGEQLLFKFLEQSPLGVEAGTPEGDNSFYYSNVGTMQLQVYGGANAVYFGFGYTVVESTNNRQDEEIDRITDSVENIDSNVSFLLSNLGVVSDADGNKYKMIVQNGAIALRSLNFRNVLCVGNSYTIHPTTSDTGDYATSLWWGHWAMAASTKATSWPVLLQSALRQKNNDAVVTPVFGRRYETNPTTYNLSNSNTFTYWDGSAWQSLKDNVTDFSSVDAVVFFLGANYSGNDWYTLYKNMVEQFMTWFPNATIFCCSCTAWANNNDSAVQAVANEKTSAYISMVGISGPSRIGSYVNGDDNNLHQIDNSAVANHFGDYGEYQILDRICGAMGYTNNAALHNISITNPAGVGLSVISTATLKDAIVSVFASIDSGTTLSSITVKDSSNNTVPVTDHGSTDYGRVFTFIMPDSDVTITGTTA